MQFFCILPACCLVHSCYGQAFITALTALLAFHFSLLERDHRLSLALIWIWRTMNRQTARHKKRQRGMMPGGGEQEDWLSCIASCISCCDHLLLHDSWSSLLDSKHITAIICHVTLCKWRRHFKQLTYWIDGLSGEVTTSVDDPAALLARKSFWDSDLAVKSWFLVLSLSSRKLRWDYWQLINVV